MINESELKQGSLVSFKDHIWYVNKSIEDDQYGIIYMFNMAQNKDCGICVEEKNTTVPCFHGVATGSNMMSRLLVLKEGTLVDAPFVQKKTLSEIEARIEELEFAVSVVWNRDTSVVLERIRVLKDELKGAPKDILSSILESHKVLCKIKEMGEKEAYGQNPAFYYAAGVVGEAGELMNGMVKAFRGGGDSNAKLLEAVKSELPDVIIYSFVLAYVLDIDLNDLVAKKSAIVTKRAEEGYYGGPLVRGAVKPCDAPDDSDLLV